MSNLIDWDNHYKQILTSVYLSDEETKQAIDALFIARDEYYYKCEVPNKIHLTDTNGKLLHVITSKYGTPTTVYFSPKQNILGIDKPVAIGLAVAAVLLIVGYLWIKKD